jgi:OmpA-OmpF porin, OOP family
MIMKKPASYFLLSLLLGCLSPMTFAQQQEDRTLWANRIIDVSSSYNQGILFKEGINYNQYPAARALGIPDVLPGNYGDSPNAWIPQRPDGRSFIKLGFDYPIKMQQVAVAESRNPGALSEIYAYDLEGNEYLVAELDAEPVNARARVFNVFIDPTPYEVYSVKLVFNGSVVPGYNAIDAVAVSSSPIPVDASIDIAEDVNPDLIAEEVFTNGNNNTNYISLKPIISPNGNLLFFSRESPKNVGGPTDPEDIWYLEHDPATDTWGEPQNPGKPLNNRGSNFVSSVSQSDDGFLLVLGNAYQGDGRMTSGVSTSKKTGDTWSMPQALDIDNFYNYAMSANYYLSRNQRYLLMSVERDDSRGTRDLYVSFHQDENSWTEPINLGNQVNTPDLESSPFIAEDDSTLFFSSRGYSGFGGEDVFVTHRLDDTWQNWSTPKNLGPIINSERDDTFFNIAANEDFAYLTRGKINDADLYRVNMPIFKEVVPEFSVQGLVYNVRNNMPVSAEVVIRPLNDNAEEMLGDSREDGIYNLNLPPGEYEIFARRKGYKPVEQQTVTIEEGNSAVLRDLYLIDDFSEINISEQLSSNMGAIASEEILFEYNKFQLSRRAYQQLEEVAEFLKKDESLKLRIEGHTCDIGSVGFNEELSEKRAQSVANFLNDLGIASSRLITVGKGEYDPLVPNSTSGNRKINRRVEFKVLP